MKLPKVPKGLQSSLKKLQAKIDQKKKVDARKKEIIAMRKKKEQLQAALRK
jgi:hypothetical protein